MFGNTTEAPPDPSTSNIVGQGTTIEGNLHATGNLRVEGTVVGEVTTKAKVVLGSTAQVKGNIRAKCAEVAGTVNGTTKIDELLVLRASAVIRGDLFTNKLALEEGAKLNGRCHVGSESSTHTSKHTNHADKVRTKTPPSNKK